MFLYSFKPTSTDSGSAPQSVGANIMAIHDNAGIRISQQVLYEYLQCVFNLVDSLEHVQVISVWT